MLFIAGSCAQEVNRRCNLAGLDDRIRRGRINSLGPTLWLEKLFIVYPVAHRAHSDRGLQNKQDSGHCGRIERRKAPSQALQTMSGP